MPVTEVNVLNDYGLTLDHFYSIVKKSLGDLGANTYLQIQATAVPFDVSTQYPFFSLANISRFGDMTISPEPVSHRLLTNPLDLLSRQYYAFLSQLLSLVEAKELDSQTRAEIDKYVTANNNLSSHLNAILQQRLLNWQIYADSTMTPRGDLAAFQHWSDGQAISTEIHQVTQQMHQNQALVEGLRMRSYADPFHQEVVNAFSKFVSPASRTRYPRYDDRLYGDEQAKFGPIYFARLADNESGAFANRQITTVNVSLETISNKPLGSFSDTVAKHSQANSSIITDWKASGRGGWGPFKVKANATSHKEITEDFLHTENITVGAKSLQALPLDMSAWFEPGIFDNPLVLANRRLFERYLGEKGSLFYIPTHLIVAKGFNLAFHSSQDWKHDYTSTFSAGGGGSASFFGISIGGGGNYSQNVHEQKIEKRGHDLVLDDGDNIRLIGYNVVKNDDFLDKVAQFALPGAKLAFAGM